MNQQLYNNALQVIEQIKKARLEQMKIERAMNVAEYALNLAHAKVERVLIAKMGGDEKRLGLNMDTRERSCLLALDADESYRQKRAEHETLKSRFEEVKIEASARQNMFQVMIAAMRAQDIRIEVPLDEEAGAVPAASAVA